MQLLHYFCASFLFRKWQNCECDLPWRGVGKFNPLTVTSWHHFVPKATTPWTFYLFSGRLGTLALSAPVSPRRCSGPAQRRSPGLAEGRSGRAPCIIAVCGDHQPGFASQLLREGTLTGFLHPPPPHLSVKHIRAFPILVLPQGFSFPAHTTPIIHVPFRKSCSARAIGGFSMKIKLYIWVQFSQ